MITTSEEPVSVVVTMRNSASTIVNSLRSIASQNYPVAEIIVVDNVSTDDSVALVEQFGQQQPVPVRIIRMPENFGLCASFNAGVKEAISSSVILMHSDSSLPTRDEIRKLTGPSRQDPAVVATCPKLILPESIWNGFPFWQKALFARVVGKEIAVFTGKFDCVKRDVFLRIGGFDENLFNDPSGFGGEDGDLYLRLCLEGRVTPSEARVVHLHYLGANYTLADFLKNRKVLARTYGRFLTLHPSRIPSNWVLFVKPVLAIIPLLPHFHLAGIVLLFLFSFLNSRKLYISSSSVRDPRTLSLPFVDIFLVFYETFWMIEGWIRTVMIRRTPLPPITAP